jgi:hypothetical protein
MTSTDTVGTRAFVCPMCLRKASGGHHCPPLNRFESWAAGHVLRALARRAKRGW